MTMQKYSVNQHLIETLRARVKFCEIAIPEVQRPFVRDVGKGRNCSGRPHIAKCVDGWLVCRGITGLDELSAKFAENAVPVSLFDNSSPEYSDFLSERRKLMASRFRDYYSRL